MEVLRVVVAKDHPVFRQGLRTVLKSVGGIEVVAEAATGAEAVAATREHSPDVGGHGHPHADAQRHRGYPTDRAEQPGHAVVMLTLSEDDEFLFAAMRAGAQGYLLKEASASEIVRAVQAVAEGEAIFGPTVARQVMAYFSGARSGQAPLPFPELTERKREVLELIARGENNPSIARLLFVSPKTVRNHVSNIFPSCRWPIGHRPSCGPGRPGWDEMQVGSRGGDAPRSCHPRGSDRPRRLSPTGQVATTRHVSPTTASTRPASRVPETSTTRTQVRHIRMPDRKLVEIQRRQTGANRASRVGTDAGQ
jgi:DNA-binding NarL/FixJ family response regulator